MKIHQINDMRFPLWARLITTLILFVVAFFLDNAFTDLNIYPLYLASILYAAINISFCSSLPISTFAAYLSLIDEGLGAFSLFNTLIVRTILLVTIAYLFKNNFELAKTYHRRFELLKTLVPQCPDCGSIYCNDGKWRSMEQISDDPSLLGALPIHGCIDKADPPYIITS